MKRKNKNRGEYDNLAELARLLIETLVFGKHKLDLAKREIKTGHCCLYDECDSRGSTKYFVTIYDRKLYSFHQQCLTSFMLDYMPVKSGHR